MYHHRRLRSARHASGMGSRSAAALAALACLLATCAAVASPEGDASAFSPGIGSALDGALKWFTLNLARLVELSAAFVIAVASAKAMWAYARTAGVAGPAQPKEEIRLSLGRSLALALEFELGADILKTAVAPTWNDIGLLAAIAVLRTALNFFLEQELRRAEARGAERT